MNKHFVILKDKEFHYLCNQACSVIKEKSTNDYFEVTCKNCKRILNKDREELSNHSQVGNEEKLTHNEGSNVLKKSPSHNKKPMYVGNPDTKIKDKEFLE